MKNLTFFKPKILNYWSEETWKATETWLEEIEKNIITLKARVKRGGDFDKWDIETRNGLFSTSKGIITIEEHGSNNQYVKLKYWVNYSVQGFILILIGAAISVFAALDKSWAAASVLVFLTFGLIGKYVFDSASVANCIITTFNNLSSTVEKESKLTPVKVAEVNEEVLLPPTLPKEEIKNFEITAK
ncbi:MAG: hypothetical protein WKG06_12005 [Segetibacter sp.]